MTDINWRLSLFCLYPTFRSQPLEFHFRHIFRGGNVEKSTVTRGHLEGQISDRNSKKRPSKMRWPLGGAESRTRWFKGLSWVKFSWGSSSWGSGHRSYLVRVSGTSTPTYIEFWFLLCCICNLVYRVDRIMTFCSRGLIRIEKSFLYNSSLLLLRGIS